MASITLVCADDKLVEGDPDAIRDRCPRVLWRFLGQMEGAFRAPATDDEGRLTFPRDYDISQADMTACIGFLRTGVVVKNVLHLGNVFNRIGGCDAYDREIMGRAVIVEEQKHENPLRPADDMKGRFQWCAGKTPEDFPGDSSEWSATSRVRVTLDHYWWRRAVSAESRDEADELER